LLANEPVYFSFSIPVRTHPICFFPVGFLMQPSCALYYLSISLSLAIAGVCWIYLLSMVFWVKEYDEENNHSGYSNRVWNWKRGTVYKVVVG